MRTTRFLTITLVLGCLCMPLAAQVKAPADRVAELRMNCQVDSALALATAYLASDPGSASLWYEKAKCLDWVKTQDLDKFSDARKYLYPRLLGIDSCLRTAATLDPGNAQYQYALAENGLMLWMVRLYTPWKWPGMRPQVKRSLRYYEEAVTLDPGFHRARYSLVNCARFGWLMGGSAKKARAHADSLVFLSPILGVQANELLASKRHPFDALEAYRALLIDDPENPELLFLMAKAFSDKDSTLAYCKRILDLDPHHHQALERLFIITPPSRQLEIKPYITRYMEAVKYDYALYQSIGFRLMGRYMQREGDAELAQEYFDRARELNPQEVNPKPNDWSYGR